MSFFVDLENSKLVDKFLEDELAINIAVAFLGKAAWKYFKNSKANISILCNLESGATNPFIVEKLVDKKNIKIKTNSKLHTKVYIGKSKLIVGSANLSANGLSYEDNEINGWIEASLTTSDKNEINKANLWFESIWRKSANITTEDIKTAKINWAKKRNNRFINSKNNESVVNAIKNNEFKDKEVYLTIYRQYASKDAQEKWEDVERNYGKSFDYYEDWDEIPSNSFCIDLYYGPRGKKEVQGLFKTPEYPVIEEFQNIDGEISNLNIVHKVKNIFGKYRLSALDKEIIESHTAEIWEKYNIKNDDAVLVKLHDIRHILT